MRVTTEARLRVLVVGPKPAAANSRGGMATVVSLMRDFRDPRVAITIVGTYVDDTRRRRLAVGVLGMLRSTLLVLTGRVDVLHVHLAHRGSVVRKAVPLLAARMVGVATVIHAHSYDFAAWFDGLPSVGQALVRRLLPARMWLALGERLAEQYRSRLRLPPERVRVLANPAPLPGWTGRGPAPRSPGDTVGLAALGRLGERKGSYDLVAALAQLDGSTRQRLVAVAAGDGETDEVRRAASRAGVADVLDVRGWLGPSDRDRVLDDSEILVLTSYAEGLPMALLEAMGWGLVPIVSPVGGIPEVVTDGVDAITVDAGDVPALTKAIELLVEDDELRRTMGAAAHARAAQFSVEAWFERLVEFWSIALAAPH